MSFSFLHSSGGGALSVRVCVVSLTKCPPLTSHHNRRRTEIHIFTLHVTADVFSTRPPQFMGLSPERVQLRFGTPHCKSAATTFPSSPPTSFQRESPSQIQTRLDVNFPFEPRPLTGIFSLSERSTNTCLTSCGTLVLVTRRHRYKLLLT